MFHITEENQVRTLIITDSRYGTAAEYARKLQDLRDADLLDAHSAKLTKVRPYRTILFIGSVYDGRLSILDTAQTLIKKLTATLSQNRDTQEYEETYRFGVLAVGLSEGEVSMDPSKEGIFVGGLMEEVPVLFAKGRLDPEALSARDRLTISLWKKRPEETLPSWKKRLIQATEEGRVLDETDESYLDPLIEIIDGRF